MKISDCYNVDDFRKLAKQKLPSPIFHYIDGGSDDETTLKRNTDSFNKCDLIPSVLTDVSKIDLSTKILGQEIKFPLFLSPAAMHQMYHPDGEKGTAKAAEKFGTFFSLSTMANTSIEDVSKVSNGPKMFQLYIHKDQGLTDNLIERCKHSGFNAMCLTVDTIVAGNRERDHRTGFTTPPSLSLSSLLSFAMHPEWCAKYLLGGKLTLANVSHITKKGSSIEMSIMDYLNEQFDRSMNWKHAEYAIKKWNGPFALKGIMSVEDAKKAIDVGASAIMISNHGGRQLDGSSAPFDQLQNIVDAVGGKIEIILDGGIKRGTHVLKALALGANACSVGKAYLYGLSAGGQKGVEQVVGKLRDEIERGMTLMGCRSISELTKDKISFR